VGQDKAAESLAGFFWHANTGTVARDPVVAYAKEVEGAITPQPDQDGLWLLEVGSAGAVRGNDWRISGEQPFDR
jgi:hypothetical protein